MNIKHMMIDLSIYTIHMYTITVNYSAIEIRSISLKNEHQLLGKI